MRGYFYNFQIIFHMLNPTQAGGDKLQKIFLSFKNIW